MAMDAELENLAAVLSREEAGNFAVMCAIERGKVAIGDGGQVTQGDRFEKCGWRQFGGCGDCGLRGGFQTRFVKGV